MLASTLDGVYSILFLSVGIMLVGLVAPRSTFSRSAAYVGVATGILGIVSVVGPVVQSGLSAAAVIASALTTVWVFLVSYRLYRLSSATA